MNKALVVMLLTGLFPITGYTATNLADVGEETKVNRTEFTTEPAISLDGITLPKGVYYSDFSVVVRTEATLQEGVEIQFETWDYKLGFFVEGNAKLEKGVFLHPVNSKGDESKWAGMFVMPGGRLEADNITLEGVDQQQFAWWLIYGTAIIRNSDVARVRVAADSASGIFGNLTIDNCTISGLSISTEPKVSVSNSLLRLSHPEGTSDPVHVLIAFSGMQADFSQNNKWEGGKPVFWVYDGVEGGMNNVVTDVRELEKRGIKILPPTAVEQLGWGAIKKIFMK